MNKTVDNWIDNINKTYGQSSIEWTKDTKKQAKKYYDDRMQAYKRQVLKELPDYLSNTIVID